MMECDKLYGVTMQERGVSKHVAVTIDDVGKEGEIAATAYERTSELPIVETCDSPQTVHAEVIKT